MKLCIDCKYSKVYMGIYCAHPNNGTRLDNGSVVLRNAQANRGMSYFSEVSCGRLANWFESKDEPILHANKPFWRFW